MPTKSQLLSQENLFYQSTLLTNMEYSIVETLMERDNLERCEAEDIKDELKNQALAYLAEGDIMSAMDIMYEVGLEPDYLEDLLLC